MKLSFSTRGWWELSFKELKEKAAEMGFQGLELYNVLKVKKLTEKAAR